MIVRSLFSALLAFSLSGPVVAEEGGRLLVRVGETEYGFDLLANQSDWSGAPDFGSASIFSVPSDQSGKDAFSNFTLGFEFGGGATRNPEVRLARKSAGGVERLFGDDYVTDFAVTIDAMAVDGEYLAIQGSFSGGVGASADFGRTVDPASSVPVSGTFDVRLGPV